MATGDTLLVFVPLQNEAPASGYATQDLRNGHYVLDFDDTTPEAAIFKAIMPRHYAAGGLTVYLHWSATSATTGTGGWTVEFERVGDGVQDLDADGFAAAQTIVAETVPPTNGDVAISSVAIPHGAGTASIVAGEGFRMRVKRDVANDTAGNDLELWAIELAEGG